MTLFPKPAELSHFMAPQVLQKSTFWFLFLFCGSVCFWQGLECLKKYTSHPQITRILVKASEDTYFPSITFCLDVDASSWLTVGEEYGPYFNETSLCSHCALCDEEYLNNGTWKSNSCPDPEVVWDRITYGIDVMLYLAKFKFKNGSSYVTKPSKNEDSYLWRSFDQSFRKCHTLVIPEDWIRERIIEILFSYREKVSVYFHTPGVFLTADNRLYISMDRLYRQTNTELSYEVFEMLDYEGMECESSPSYSKDKCAIEKAEQLMFEKLGCTTPFAHTRTKVPICTNSTVGKEAVTLYDSVFSNGNHSYLIEQCPHPCTYFDSRYEIKKKDTLIISSQNTRDNPRGNLQVKLKPTVKVTSAFYSYSFLSMVAEFGGYVGLFLGMSIIQIADVLAKAFNRLT